MASILIVSKHGSGIPLALHLAKQEGHLVKIWIKDKQFRNVLEGSTNPKLVNTYNVNPQSIDLAIGDMVGIGNEIAELKAKGILTACGSVFNDKMELDRVYGMKVAQAIYNKSYIPDTIPCKSKIDIDNALDNDKAMVIKPLGNKAVGLTLVSNDTNNRSLKSFIENNADDILPCIVQEVVNGIELTIEGWFSKEWLKDSFNCTIESKRFLNNDKGPNVGCMGNVVWPCKENKLVKEFLYPATELLEKVD
jgi:phosphoribosylamine-glycine ligase